MAVIQDFSDWDSSLRAYALELIGSWEVLLYDPVANTLGFHPRRDETYRRMVQNRVEGFLFWFGFGVAIENLTKAVMLKHQVSIVKRRNVPSSAAPPTDPAVTRAYRGLLFQVSSRRNPWLEAEFAREGIKVTRELSTPTLGMLARSNVRSLEATGKISSAEARTMTERILALADLRRNVDLHVYLKTLTVGSANGDFDDVYVPLANQLLDVYERP